MSMHQIAAAKKLVDFVRDFTALTERQIEGIQEHMADTVMDIMDTIQKIGDAADKGLEKANEIIVKNEDGSNGEFSMSSFAARESIERSSAGKPAMQMEALENEIRRVGGKFSKQMEALSALDGDIQDLLFSVIGAVSSDDVLAQRLNHIVNAIHALNGHLAAMIVEQPAALTENRVAEFRQKVLSAVYKCYTMESEKELFHQIFGQPKRKEAS